MAIKSENRTDVRTISDEDQKYVYEILSATHGSSNLYNGSSVIYQNGNKTTTLATAVANGWSNATGLIRGWEAGAGSYGYISASDETLKDFKDYICRAANQKNYDPYMLVALFAVEPTGNPWETSGNSHGLGQCSFTGSVPKCSDLGDVKAQVAASVEHLYSKETAIKGVVTNGDNSFYMYLMTAYNAGEGFVLDYMKDGATYDTIVKNMAAHCRKHNFGSADPHIQYYPKILAAYRCLSSHNFLSGAAGVTGSGIKTRTDFETNSSTDWLLSPSEDERKYGINIYEGQQPLIKFSTANAITDDKTNNAVKALRNYSEFLYYLLNSEVSTAAVQCLSMPWIRPGFNVWYDPLYADRVYYCMAVQHQGDPHNGASTNLSLILGRPSSTFVNDASKFGSLKGKSDNVLINEMKEEYRVSKFGDTLDNQADFQAVKDATRAYYGSESFETVSAEHSEFHKEIYAKGVGVSPVPPEIDKNKIFSGEYTKEQIESQLSALYGSAPSVVKNRVSKLRDVIAAADEYIEQYHLLEHHTS